MPITEAQAVARLKGLRADAIALEQDTITEVWSLRTGRNVPWSVIGEVFGISKQAAHKRWGYLDKLQEAEHFHAHHNFGDPYATLEDA